MSQFPMDNPELDESGVNPFDQSGTDGQPRDGLESEVNVRPLLENSGLPKDALAHSWRLADWDRDGSLVSDQFGVALHLIKAVEMGAQLADKLPPFMIPNRKI